MRAVVTGATSMIGVAIIKKCIENNCNVLAIVRKGTDRLQRLPSSDLIHIEYADLNELASVTGDGKTYDVFYHLALAHTSKSDRENPILQEQNIKYTLDAVQLAHKLDCKKFIGAGSQAEYGIINGIIDANTRPAPITAYGMAKLSAGLLSKRLCEQLGITHIWGRIFSVYGINDNPGTMLNYAIEQFLKGEPAYFSAATQMWNYLYEDDAGMMFYLLGVKEVNGGIYCIANCESRVLRTYIEELAGVFGGNQQYIFNAEANGNHTVTLQADISGTVDAIGYLPQTSFEEGIGRVIMAKRKHTS